MTTDPPQPDNSFPMNTGKTPESREDAASLVEQQRAVILQRIHALLGHKARNLTDTEEILSTVMRRVDQVIEKGQLGAQSEAQFFSFVHRVIERTILEKARTSNRLTSREQIAHRLHLLRSAEQPDPNGTSAEELNAIGRLISDPVDREVILLKGRGLKHTEIAHAMGMSPQAVRKRWSRVRSQVMLHIEENREDDR